MKPITLILADDHQDALENIKCFIDDLPDFQLIGLCKNGIDLFEEVMLKKPDLILTDINMPGLNGLQAIKKCRAFYPQLKVIFLTGYDKYAVEAFELAVLDYMVKPIEKDRFLQAMERAKKIITLERYELGPISEEQQIKVLPLKEMNSTRYIPFKEIYFIEKVGKKCLINTKREIYETNEPIGKLLSRLDDSFFQTHRSNIINLHMVSEITPHHETYIVYFKDYDKQASISKLKIQEARERLEVIG